MKYQEAEYKFFEHHSTWVQAQRICSWFQAELASVHSEAELRFLGQNLKKVPGDGDVTVGLHSLPCLFHPLLEGPGGSRTLLGSR